MILMLVDERDFDFVPCSRSFSAEGAAVGVFLLLGYAHFHKKCRVTTGYYRFIQVLEVLQVYMKDGTDSAQIRDRFCANES